MTKAAQTISVLLFENFSNHCLANAVEPFRAANTISQKSLYDWQFVSLDGGTVSSSSGLPVETLKWSKADTQGDYLFIMPSYGFQRVASAIAPVLRSAKARFGMLVGFDTGAWLLAHAGLLQGRRATIHWDELTNLAETFPDTDVREDRFVIDGDIATCGGASTAIELSLKLIEGQHTPMFALEVAALFMHGGRQVMHDPYLGVTTDRLVRAAASMMRRNIEDPLSIPALAAQLKIAQRTLEETFERTLKVTPRTAYKSIRLREARRLVELSELKITEIAARCGYRDASALTRAYRLEFGVSPRGHRRVV